MKFKILTALPALIAVTTVPVSADAASLGSLLIPGGVQSLGDDDSEYLINAGTATDTILDKGDSLRGMFRINDINGTLIGAGTSFPEITAVFQTKVLDKVTRPSGLIEYTFGPDPAFEADICGGITSCSLSVDLDGDGTSGEAVDDIPGTGAMVVLFYDTAPNYNENLGAPGPTDDDTTGGGTTGGGPAQTDIGDKAEKEAEEALIESAVDGVHLGTLGFSGVGGAADVTEGEFWVAVSASDDVSDALAVTDATTFVSLQALNGAGIGLSLLQNGTAPIEIVPVSGAADVAGNGAIGGVSNLVNTPFELSSGIDLTANLKVPEPATLGILGTGLLGLGFLTNRRRRNTK